MGFAFGFFLVLLLLSAAVAVLLTLPAARIASFLRMFLPGLAIAGGIGLSLIGRMGFGIPLLLLGVTLWRRNRGVQTAAHTGTGRKSFVRSAMFEMELDHDTGDMDGMVLTGTHEGNQLSRLSEEELYHLHGETRGDDESRALLESYLDRRVPGWRENTQSDPDAGHAGTTGSGPMTKEEAYQILGLSPGATAQEVREAHRRLMKRIHPDSGGSTFLASKINEAKDILLG